LPNGVPRCEAADTLINNHTPAKSQTIANHPPEIGDKPLPFANINPTGNIKIDAMPGNAFTNPKTLATAARVSGEFSVLMSWKDE
jgi:hypothetical protein